MKFAVIFLRDWAVDGNKSLLTDLRSNHFNPSVFYRPSQQTEMLEKNQAIQNCYEGPVSALPSLQPFLRSVVGHRLLGVTARISRGMRDPCELLQAGEQKLSWSHLGRSLPCKGRVQVWELFTPPTAGAVRPCLSNSEMLTLYFGSLL